MAVTVASAAQRQLGISPEVLDQGGSVIPHPNSTGRSERDDAREISTSGKSAWDKFKWPVIILGLSVAGYFAYQHFFKKPAVAPVAPLGNPPAPAQAPVVSAPVAQ